MAGAVAFLDYSHSDRTWTSATSAAKEVRMNESAGNRVTSIRFGIASTAGLTIACAIAAALLVPMCGNGFSPSA